MNQSKMLNVVNNLAGGGASQSLVDRLQSAKFSIAGQGLAKSIMKATTEEIIGPKRKHVDYLIQCTQEANVSIPTLADLLMDRTKHTNWVVVFKSLITIHHLMNYGNERFNQYIASNNYSFNLASFTDKTTVQGYDMSVFIRRYAKYINAKATSYRLMAFDFCKIKRGKEEGVLRSMPPDRLLKTLPTLQGQVDALLEFDAQPNELSNGVVSSAFMLLFKDLIRLFACYNDGVINLLEKFFEMSKKQCREGLDLYKKFLLRMDTVGEFFKVAEKVGIDRGDIPDLTKAPASLLEALETHVGTLEGRKKGAGPPKPPPPGSNLSDEDKQKALDEERRLMQQFEANKVPTTPSVPDFFSAPEEPANDPFATVFDSSPVATPQDDKKKQVDSVMSAFAPAAAPAANPFGGAPAASNAAANPFADLTAAAPAPSNNAFDLFATPTPAANPKSLSAQAANANPFFSPSMDNVGNSGGGMDIFGEILKPQNTAAPANPGPFGAPPAKTDNPLDANLASLASQLNMGTSPSVFQNGNSKKSAPPRKGDASYQSMAPLASNNSSQFQFNAPNQQQQVPFNQHQFFSQQQQQYQSNFYPNNNNVLKPQNGANHPNYFSGSLL